MTLFYRIQNGNRHGVRWLDTALDEQRNRAEGRCPIQSCAQPQHSMDETKKRIASCDAIRFRLFRHAAVCLAFPADVVPLIPRVRLHLVGHALPP